METVCGNVVKRIELEKRMNLLKVGFSHFARMLVVGAKLISVERVI